MTSKPNPEAIEAFRSLTQPLPADTRMDAYYYSFEPTGVGAIDAILSAVAHAGKAFHNTSEWDVHDEWQTLPHGGETPAEWIQNAANAAARAIENATDWWEVDQ